MNKSIIEFIRDQYGTKEKIPLHEPLFTKDEYKLVSECIDTTFVSSTGPFVNKFENLISNYTGSQAVIATTNGTSALHTSLILAGVCRDDLVITQSFTFVATCNAIEYCGASPILLDIDVDTLGLSPAAVKGWLEENGFIDSAGLCRHKKTNRVIRACLPMHTFGHPCHLDDLIELCGKWNLALVEDAAESLGSFYRGKHTGTFGVAGAISFNGNKIITTGGGGAVLTSGLLGGLAKHITTTAKLSDDYFHDQVGFNYRLPNLNAALGCAQIAKLHSIVSAKRRLASNYINFFNNTRYKPFLEPQGSTSNYWLNSIVCEDRAERDQLCKYLNKSGIMARSPWILMGNLPMYETSLRDSQKNAVYFCERILNLPSTAPGCFLT